MFSVDSLTLVANLAMALTASSVIFSFHAFGLQQRDVLLDQRIFGLGKNADEVLSFSDCNSTRIGKRLATRVSDPTAW